MDTERDENQNLKNDIDPRQNNSVNSNDTAESIKNNWYENDLAENQHPADTDYTDDQNNSSTGYSENLLEKELDQDRKNKEDDSENDSDIEDDLIVKNGIIINNENTEDQRDPNENDSESDNTSQE